MVDSKVDQQVSKKVTSFNGITFSSMDVKMYENDSLIANTYARGESINECLTMATLDGDTINILGFAGMFAGFGYRIALFNDTCIVTHYAKSDAEIYKLHRNDSLLFGVDVPCKTYKLTLAKAPAFKKGDVVEGTVELTSEDYYEVANGRESKYSMHLTGYFRTDPLGSLEDGHKRRHNK